MLRFELIESNENELRYARKGKDATVAYAQGGSIEQLHFDCEGRWWKEKAITNAEWLKDTKKKTCVCCEGDPQCLTKTMINDDARIRDFTGEMIIREEEIVLTESYDGREPYTITLKLQNLDGNQGVPPGVLNLGLDFRRHAADARHAAEIDFRAAVAAAAAPQNHRHRSGFRRE